MDNSAIKLDGLDGYQFEELIAKIMKKAGYDKIRITPKSRDVGKDIIMEGSEGEIVLVECKHQKFIGRPVIQRLQGAINHEENQHPDKKVRGILVTSGAFSQEAINYNKEIGNEIELIDGKELKKLCKNLDVIILNGKVQIITNKSFKNISKKESIELSNKEYSKIYWSKVHKPSVSTELKFSPVCYINYNVNFDTHTSVGCIDNYSSSGEVIVDGITGKNLDEEPANFFFSGRIDTEEIKPEEENKKMHFEFTENDIEDHAIELIVQGHTHNKSYVGKNNVVYSKTCIPKKRDIDLKQFLSVYLPTWTNQVNIMKMGYKQKFYVKGNDVLYIEDGLKKCKICEREKEKYEDMSVCPECGRVVCHKHVKIDYLDKETPICTIHTKSVKLWIQRKYFAKDETLKEYKKWLSSRNFFQKLYEDKIAFGLSVGGLTLLGIILVSLSF